VNLIGRADGQIKKQGERSLPTGQVAARKQRNVTAALTRFEKFREIACVTGVAD
jgi:hypothetical protein